MPGPVVAHFDDHLRRLRIDRADRLVFAGQQRTRGCPRGLRRRALRRRWPAGSRTAGAAGAGRPAAPARPASMSVSIDTAPRAHLAFGERDRVLEHFVERDALDLQLNRPHELEHFDDDGVGHLGFLDDVVRASRARPRRSVELALEHAGHDLDAGQRILDLVRDGRGHLAERREPVAQALALLDLLDARQVLEEQRRADHPAVVVVDVRERVADRAAGLAQPHFGAVGQVVAVERLLQDAHDFGHVVQDFGERPADVVRPRPGRPSTR